MTEEIPPNFDKPWFDSDVILLTENADGKKLYANKGVLSIFSPVMRAMFTGSFKEANQESVELHVDYEAMKEILRILLHVDRDFTENGQKMYDSTQLIELYKAADYFDFSLIRKMCLDQIRSQPSADMAFAAAELGLRDFLIEILEEISNFELHMLIRLSSTRQIFSKKDVAFILAKLTGYFLEVRAQLSCSFNIKDIPSEIMKIDLTKKWFASDVAIKTKNSNERLLYANKGTLAANSKYFRELFFDEKMVVKKLSRMKISDKSGDCPILSLDYEYVTVKMILYTIHHYAKDYTAESSDVKLSAIYYDMYCAAAKDHLNMPSVQNFCIAGLQKEGIRSLDIVIKLNLEIKEALLKSMTVADLFNWFRPLERIYVIGDQKIWPIGDDPLLSLNDVRIMVDKMRPHMDEYA